ncbi:MAG: ParB/RepB/Spo0J family partition protein [Lachnospiraceae bacterium]|nr:ParB/RepB/Spo0J family partition protein [Lachnospiraceae bacterium]
MAEKPDWKTNMSFNIDDLFTSQDVRDNGAIETVRIDELIPFQGHTFKVIDDEKMQELVQSISEHGVMMPAIAFRNENNQLEMIAGHRRMRASELAGLETIPTIVKNINRDEATIIMGETNLQARDEILPSEKAFTYRAMLDAMKRQAGRPKENASPVATNFSKGRSDKELAEQVGESKDTIRRYIRLTYLIPELLELVDNKTMAIRPAVEISYIDHINQKNIFNYYKDTEVMDDKGKIIEKGVLPSLSQAQEFKRLADAGELDEDVISDKLGEPKPNQKEKIVLNDKRLLHYRGNLTPAEFEQKVIKALAFYEKYNQRINDDKNIEKGVF